MTTDRKPELRKMRSLPTQALKDLMNYAEKLILPINGNKYRSAPVVKRLIEEHFWRYAQRRPRFEVQGYHISQGRHDGKPVVKIRFGTKGDHIRLEWPSQRPVS